MNNATVSHKGSTKWIHSKSCCTQMSPHSLACIASSTWDRPYSRESAAFPMVWYFMILKCLKKQKKWYILQSEPTFFCSLLWDLRLSSGPQFQGLMTSMVTSISCAPAPPWTSTNLRMRSAHPRDHLPATVHFTHLPPNNSSPALYDPSLLFSSVFSFTWCLVSLFCTFYTSLCRSTKTTYLNWFSDQLAQVFYIFYFMYKKNL